MLKELAEIGMELARVLLRREAAKAADHEAGRDPQQASARVSRAVRQTVALNAQLRQQRRQPVAAKAGVAPADGPQMEPMDPARRERVLARVQALCRKSEMAGRLTAAIEVETARGDRERLLRDLDVRLDVAVNTIDFLARPIDEVIAEIRYDLGLGPKVVAARGAVDEDEGPDDEGEDEDEPGGDAYRFGEVRPPWLESSWGAAQSRPRRGSG
ncbi:MAG TPA: hypothetical protein VGI79_16280 [Caulobacteraceae bacterium]|jgi:hypothetical protein